MVDVRCFGYCCEAPIKAILAFSDANMVQNTSTGFAKAQQGRSEVEGSDDETSGILGDPSARRSPGHLVRMRLATSMLRRASDASLMISIFGAAQYWAHQRLAMVVHFHL
jgi:hypothetical protein